MYEYVPIVLLMVGTLALIKCSSLLFKSNRTRITRGRTTVNRERKAVAQEPQLIWRTLVAPAEDEPRRSRVLTKV